MSGNQETKIQYFEKIETESQHEFVKLQNHCSLCNSVLELHMGANEDNQIHEVAHCPQCQIRNRSRKYTIQ